MAAMDFPANPTNGQVYGNYIYSTATGAWNAKPLTGQKTVVSATAPATPSLGDEWFNSNDGNLYVYYTDVDGSQWVQVKSDATLSSTLGNRVTTLETYPSGLVPIVPTSVTVSSGIASIASDGLISFSGTVGTLTVNGVFSSLYRNYRVMFDVTDTSVGCDLYSQLTGPATLNSGWNYMRLSRAYGTTGGADSAGITYANIGRSNGGGGGHGYADYIQPNVNAIKAINSQSTDSGFLTISANISGAANSTAFTGFNFYPSSGTMTSGTLKVYGYR